MVADKNCMISIAFKEVCSSKFVNSRFIADEGFYMTSINKQLTIISLLFAISGCIDLGDKSQSNQSPRSGSSSTNSSGGMIFDAFIMKQIDISKVLDRYPSATHISVSAEGKGSISFGVDELGGKNSFEYFAAKSYSLTVTDSNGVHNIEVRL
tara:strand:- start:32 stop:490 length:459 start_codon:yes stop_codon:yes gene_type:complete